MIWTTLAAPLLALAATAPARAQPVAPTPPPRSPAHPAPHPVTPAGLDAVARRAIAEQRVVGASVIVVQRGNVLLHKGYGYAELGLEVATRPETAYHVVGPMLPFTGIAVMQLVERGKLSLDDDIAKYVPELPMQGHRVTIRQLLNHTSGIVDYHYLGDPIESTSRQPKALDEVLALYAGKKWVNEPGKKWDWSISGFQLLVTMVERITGESFASYAQRNLFAPAGVGATTYCDDRSLVHGLAHAYHYLEAGYAPAYENAAAYNADLRFCSTVADLYQLWKAISDKHLVEPQTFAQMTTAEGAAVHMTAKDPQASYGFAISLGHEDDHRAIGQHGSLMGYSGSLYDYPDDGLTIVVLSNTEGQNAHEIGRALAREVLGLPAPPAPRPAPPATPKPLDDAPVSPLERSQLDGSFVLALEHASDGYHDSFVQYRRTFRVFSEGDGLMIQALGDGPERLFKQADGSFATRSAPDGHIRFVIQAGHAVRMRMEGYWLGAPLVGDRIGAGDPRTFHRALK
jgi:CubicO group peptidase (beta-lactamase class C family)